MYRILIAVIYISFMVMMYSLMYQDISVTRMELIECITDMECMELNPQLGDY